MKAIYWVFLVSLLSCAPLKRSQVILVGNYFNTITGYPEFIKEVSAYEADMELQANNLHSSLITSDSLRVNSLIQSIQQYEAALQLPDSVMIELDNLDSYIRGYYLLAPNGFDVYKTLKSTTVSIVGMFGFRSVASALLPDLKTNVSAFKKRKIYAHFTNQRNALRQSARVLKAYLASYVIQEIDTTQLQIYHDVKQLFGMEHDPITPLNYYFNYNQYFSDYFQRINTIRKLALSISASLDHIVITESEINKMTSQRQKIHRDSRKLLQLTDDVRRIQKLKEELAVSKLAKNVK